MWALSLIAFSAGGFACSNDTKTSVELAKKQVRELAAAAREDVRQVRTGLPHGAQELKALLPDQGEIDAPTAREALEKARNRVQDLRVAKSTFFALALPTGLIVRNDREQDRMVGKNVFDAFPALRAAADGKVVETRGSMEEAAEVRGRPDAQWVTAAPVGAPPAVRALYVTGWSWSAYAYRLENAARSGARMAAGEAAKVPLLYVYVVVGKDVYGAPVSPDVNAKAVRDAGVIEKARGTEPLGIELELTGRGFGLAAELVPELGDQVAIAVLRSET